MRSPLVDITTFNAIESLFHARTRDPWGSRQAGELADLFVYADTLRYPFNVPTTPAAAAAALEKPSLVLGLEGRDSSVLRPLEYPTGDPFLLRDEYLEEAFAHFAVWSRNNSHALRQWLTLHDEPWCQAQYASRVPNRYIFSLDKLLRDPTLVDLSQHLHRPPHDLCYAFDVVLRYPLYGEFTGEAEHYLNHPLRDSFFHSSLTRESGTPPAIAVSFKQTVSEMAHALSQDEYTVLLHELRGTVRDAGLNKLKPGEFDKDVIREIAAKVALPPRLRALAKASAVGAGAIGGLGAIPLLGPGAALAGAVVSVSAALWSGRLPRQAARLRWLRWALEWPIEQQAQDRNER